MESELDQEKQRILDQFRNNVEDVIQPHHDDRFLLRWLRARNFVLKKAEKMYREDLKVRKKLGCDNILTTFKLSEIIQPYESTAFLGFDKEGHPVRFINIGETDLIGCIRTISFAQYKLYFIYIFEHDAKMLKERNEKTGQHVEKYTYIVDFTNLQLKQFCDKEVIQTFTGLITYYQDHYPETLHVMNMINAPNLFVRVFNIFKPFLDERVLKKIKISTDDSWQEEVFQTVPREIVPAYVGGSRFEPEGDPRCHAFLNWNGKVPTSLYMSECCSSLATDPEAHQKVISARSSFEVERSIERPDLVLSWTFQTKKNPIKFGLFYEEKVQREEDNDLNSLKGTKREEMVSLEIVDCHHAPETGEFLCSRTGTYILRFDNTFSWMTSKHLFYKIEVREDTAPEQDVP